MRKKKAQEIGFSLARLNNNIIEIEGIPDKNLSKKKKKEAIAKYSNVSLYLFPEDYILKLQNIGNTIEERNIDRKSILKKSVTAFAEALMK